ncbi:NADH dehydrogenase [ubiquinone] iron-sulfur protein 5-like [Atheta coriaria]|uniref:NADH dehydrogenase [ubiquinone] iron-sulfur protein 5-like n=1 Tax=Dalotia coriaria TaxID=877792 RepID=UPI0031F3B159
MSVCPWFRSPFSDLTAQLVSHQWYGRCADFELKVMECFEAYGLDKGMRECDTLIQDFKECQSRTKQRDRAMAMRMERHKQYFKGERKEHYAESPRIDAF